MSIQRREQLPSLDCRQSRGGPSEVVSQHCKNVQEEVGAKAWECETAFASLEWGRLRAGALAVGTVQTGALQRSLTVERAPPRSLDCLHRSGQAPGGLKHENELHSGQNTLGDRGMWPGTETGGQTRAMQPPNQQPGAQWDIQSYPGPWTW